MKKILFLLVCIILIALLSSCSKDSNYYDIVKTESEIIKTEPQVVKTESETIKLSDEFKNQIIIDIDESSIKNDIAIVKITQPDLIKIFDEVLAQKANEQEEKLLDEMIKNLGKYTIETSVESAVANNSGRWELKTRIDVDNEIGKSVNDFLAHYLSQIKFNEISWEDSK